MKEQQTTLLTIPAKQSTSNQSIQSFQSIINQLSVEQSKFCSTFIENYQLFEVHVNSFDINHVNHLFGFGTKFVMYQLKIVTDHLCFYVQKRYRDFLDLFNRVSKLYQPKIVFPKKTHFTSKVCPILTQNRSKIFDDFLCEIISLRHCNKSVISQLIVFLDIRNHYKQLNIDQQIFKIQNIADYIKIDKSHLFGHFLRHQLLKIQVIPGKSLRSLSKLQNLLCSINRNYIKVDDLRSLLLGNNKIPGLMEIALSNNNQVVSLTFLKQVKNFFDNQICPYAEIFQKIYQRSPIHTLFLNNMDLLKFQQFSTTYFQLIDLYLKLRLNHDNTRTDHLIKDILKQQALEQYVQWKVGKRQRYGLIRRKTKLQIGQFKIQQENIYTNIDENTEKDEQYCSIEFHKQVNIIFDNKTLSQNRYKQICRQDNSYCQVSADKNFMHFVVISKKNYAEICEIVNKFRHNKLITSYYPPLFVLTKVNKIFFSFQGKSEKLFQFEQEISEKQDKFLQINNKQLNQTNKLSQNQLNIVMTPSKQLKKCNSFYYHLKVKKLSSLANSVQIMYFFHNKKIKKMFQQECLGKSTIMWQSLCTVFLQSKQATSFSSVKTQQTANEQNC